MDLRRLSTIGWYAGEAVVIAVCGISLLAAGGWVLSRIARRYGQDETPMGTTKQTFGKLPAKEYDDICKEAVRRRAAASYRQKQSAQIASGENPPEAKRIEIVR